MQKPITLISNLAVLARRLRADHLHWHNLRGAGLTGKRPPQDLVRLLARLAQSRA
jgi:hypothetical protein